MPTAIIATKGSRPHIRRMIRRDMPEVLDVEEEGFEFPWLKEEFIRCLRQRNCIGMVAEHDDRVVGFMVCKIHKHRIRMLNFAVAADRRRQGVGRHMLAKMIRKLSSRRRRFLDLMLRESNLGGQLFMRQAGFRAVKVVRRPYQENEEDGYLMRYQFQPAARCPLPTAHCPLPTEVLP